MAAKARVGKAGHEKADRRSMACHSSGSLAPATAFSSECARERALMKLSRRTV